ncbi:hypothetical protein SADUNF_Sadunf16G0066300 [Salix dunnii]|uniref:Uncharacterized protein n=1 Tax=Salix dunnii TaxID=1413687 RepID=A0A835J7C9_9ROSI|nr:hypothetical protein SADUNF_Sadunf16G0066300 [Salix dunnii]
MKGSSDNATTPESKEILIEEVQPVEASGNDGRTETANVIEVEIEVDEHPSATKTTENTCSQKEETKEQEECGSGLVKLPLKKLDPEAPDKISTVRSTSISAEELSMVLKHYGLDCQDENEKHLPAET